MRRIVCIGIALLLLAAAGCTAPSPAPTVTPMVTQAPAPAEATTIPSVPPDNAGGAGTGGNAGGTGDTIPDYAEGTVVNEADVPEITAALQEKYEGAKVTGITQGMQGTQQVYIVEYTTQDGKVETAYIAPGGAFVSPAPGGTNSNSTANPAATTSPAA